MIKNIPIGGWEIAVSDEREDIKRRTINELEGFLNEKWRKCIAASFEPINWSMRQLGIPSIVVRMDCSPNMTISPYEVDIDPAGMGLSTVVEGGGLLLEKYVHCLKALNIRELQTKVYPSTASFTKENELFTMAIEKAGIRVVNTEASVIHMVASADDSNLPGFQNDLEKALSYTLENKRDLLAMGTAVSVQTLFQGKTDEEIWQYLERTYLPAGFVIKPISGYGTGHGEKIGFLFFSEDKRYKKYCDSKTKVKRQIRSLIEQKLEYLIQPFYGPTEKEIGGKSGFQIYRIYFVYNPITGQYEFAGGFWNWRYHTMRIHGASDAIFGYVGAE